nr:hypothetical protein [Prochlorococcus sp. AH-736-M13]
MSISSFLTKKFLKSLFFPAHNRGEALPKKLVKLLKNADNIVVVDKGKIVESGKHEKLLDQNKIYADLWNVQVGI